MDNIFASLGLAFVLGFVIAKLLRWVLSGRRRLRAGVILLAPLLALLASFLLFFEGTPEAEDWIWLTIGIGYFWPWYMAWGFGALAEKLIRKAFTPAAPQ